MHMASVPQHLTELPGVQPCRLPEIPQEGPNAHWFDKWRPTVWTHPRSPVSSAGGSHALWPALLNLVPTAMASRGKSSGVELCGRRRALSLRTIVPVCGFIGL